MTEIGRAPAQPGPGRPERPTTPSTPSTGYRVAAIAVFAAVVAALGFAVYAKETGGNYDIPFAAAVLGFAAAIVLSYLHDRRVKALTATATAEAGR